MPVDPVEQLRITSVNLSQLGVLVLEFSKPILKLQILERRNLENEYKRLDEVIQVSIRNDDSYDGINDLESIESLEFLS